MKKITVLAVFMITSLSTFAQITISRDNDVYDDYENNIGVNELKINMLSLIAAKRVDVAYERILNEESSFGVGLLFNLDDESYLDELRNFSLTPYYRHFFSNNGYAEGFFLEAFGMIHTGKKEFYSSFDEVTHEKYTDFAVGISAGAKFLSRRGFVAEIYAGIGRDLLDNSGVEVVGRGGISIGYRF